MSINFDANQYENAFLPHKLQNYQIPEGNTKRPDRQEGFTTVIANNRGHLLPGQPRSRESPWGSFVGTWDLPDKMPVPSKINPTARREDMVEKLATDKFEKEMIISGKLKRCKVPPPLKVKGDVEATAAATAAGLPLPQEGGQSRGGAEAPCPPCTTQQLQDASANAEVRAPSQHWRQSPSAPSPKAPSPAAAAPSPKPPIPAGLATPKPCPDTEPELNPLGPTPPPAGVEWPLPKSVTPNMA